MAHAFSIFDCPCDLDFHHFHYPMYNNTPAVAKISGVLIFFTDGGKFGGSSKRLDFGAAKAKADRHR